MAGTLKSLDSAFDGLILKNYCFIEVHFMLLMKYSYFVYKEEVLS